MGSEHLRLGDQDSAAPSDLPPTMANPRQLFYVIEILQRPVGPESDPHEPSGLVSWKEHVWQSGAPVKQSSQDQMEGQVEKSWQRFSELFLWVKYWQRGFSVQ